MAANRNRSIILSFLELVFRRVLLARPEAIRAQTLKILSDLILVYPKTKPLINLHLPYD